MFQGCRSQTGSEIAQNKIAHAVPGMVESRDDDAMQGGLRVGSIVQTYRRRLLNALFKTYRNSRKVLVNHVLNIASVDVLGCDNITPLRPYKHGLCPAGRKAMFT